MWRLQKITTATDIVIILQTLCLMMIFAVTEKGRKQMSKNKKNPVRQLRESDIKKIKLEATQNAINFSNLIFLSVNQGYVNIYDLKKTLEAKQNG